MNLPYKGDALREVADIAPLGSTQCKAVQKAPRSKLASLIKKVDKSLGKIAPGIVSHGVV